MRKSIRVESTAQTNFGTIKCFRSAWSRFFRISNWKLIKIQEGIQFSRFWCISRVSKKPKSRLNWISRRVRYIQYRLNWAFFKHKIPQKVDKKFLQHFMVPDCFESRTLPLNLSREDDCGGPIIRNSRG